MASRRPPAPRGSRGGARPRASTGRSEQPSVQVERTEQQRPPRLFTIRFAILFVIAIFALVTLIPTVRAFLTQRSEIAQLEKDVADAEQREDSLRAELLRWEDPAFVAAQARERLAFVMPGETAYKVIDPDFVQEPEPVVPDEDVHAGVPNLEDLVDVATEQPWFSSIKDSIRVAGEN